MKEQSACFTGHRLIADADASTLPSALKETVERLIQQGVTVFYAGGALGFDMLAEETVLSLKPQYPQIHLILALPCQNQEKSWSQDQKARYIHLLSQADRVIYTAEQYHRGCMHVRNRFMVDNSRYCIAYLRQTTGGTAYTADYAVKKGSTLIRV